MRDDIQTDLEMKALEAERRSADCSPAPCSASSSADEWGNVGRKALENAMAATREGRFGTAHDYRKTAEVAFAYELKLRQMPNVEPSRSECADGSESK
jgi:hypothetical protein